MSTRASIGKPQTDPKPPTLKPRVRLVSALLFLAFALAFLAATTLPRLPFFHERQLAVLSLEQLEQQNRASPATGSDPVFLYHLGAQRNAAGRFTDALPVLEQAAGMDPASARIRDEWARAQVGTGHPSDAFAQLMQFASAHPNQADAYRVLGEFHAAQKAYGAARTALEKAVALDPSDAAAWSLLANCRLNMGDTSGGQAALDQALALRPTGADSAADWLQQASLRAAAHPGTAREAFQKAIEYAPANPEAHREYARFLLAQGDVGQASSEAKTAFTLAPGDAQAYLLFGRACAQGGYASEAVAALETAARLAPTDPLPASELRRFYLQQKKPELAHRWEQEFVKRNRVATETKQLADQIRARPTDRNLRRRMAKLDAQSGDVNGCVRESALALGVKPDAPRALVVASRLLAASGKSDAALPLVRQALTQVNSVTPEMTELLGDLLLNVGRLHEAAIQYQSISDVRPDRVPVYKAQLTRAAAQLRASASPADRLVQQAEAARTAGDAANATTLAQQAVAQEPENTRALRFLLQQQFAARHTSVSPDKVRQTALRLAKLSPEDGVSRALLAVLSLEATRGVPSDEVETLLKNADPDPAASGAIWFARGLIAQNQSNAAEARDDFRRAASFDRAFSNPGANTVSAPPLKGTQP